MADKVLVQNLTDDDVIYIDNDGGVERRVIFRGQQEMLLPREMIERMMYDHGGAVLLKDYLSVKDDVIRADIGVPEDQIEYDFTLADVQNLITGNQFDSIADALDFGPQAIKDMIVEQAVALPAKNSDIVEMIGEKTGKDVAAMIRNKVNLEQAKAESGEEPVKQTSGRRVPTADRKVKTSSGKELNIPGQE